ncbi:MAG TPA: hypothetical protein GX506_02885 [Firmicutes bacterium]|nr:hypothetical protein [Bacillota bacterium]
MNIFSLINLAYQAIVAYIMVFLTWNLFELDDVREQVLTILVLIPFTLRFLGIK